ncbi:MAG TPA: 5'-nucleotidase C-terminal domain-containing protein, partial [Actinomycetota bacterium]|nr:5'-nucleotidase C-terminal domain-containing protein [Actinomycetota bacterium]
SHVSFFDEADTANAAVAELKKKNVETIIVLLHEGGSTSTAGNGAGSVAGINACVAPSGPVVDVVDRMDNEIDVVVTGHTNWAINCVLDGKIVTGAASFGRLVTDIDLTVSRASKDVVGATVNNVIVTRTVDKAEDLTALVAKYAELAAPTENRVIGTASEALTRSSTAPPAGNGESVPGDIIADAQLWATSQPGFPAVPAVVSFMNPGGIRADINAGTITYGEAFSVQPFGNILVTMTMTGQQIDAVLEQQTSGTTLQIPASLTYDRSASAAAGSRISNIRINGIAVDPLASYRVTVNNFLADGGDGFTVLRQGTDRYFGEIDLDAFARYLEAHDPIAPTPRNRITLVP